MTKDVVCIHIQWKIAVVVQSLSCVRLFETPWTVPYQTLLSFTVSQSLLKFISIELPYYLTTSFSAILFSLPSICPSIRVFSNESVVPITWPKYWSFSFSVSPSNECSGLISFRIDCFDILAVQETLKSLFQHHNSKVSILQCSAFFMAQLSHLCMTTGKNHTFDYMDFCWQSDACLCFSTHCLGLS